MNEEQLLRCSGRISGFVGGKLQERAARMSAIMRDPRGR